MRNLFDHHFTLKPGTRVYIPTDEGRERGEAIKSQIEALWTPPANYFHLQQGGHVAAVREHKDAPWLASLDLRRFFDQIARTKVHRALKVIGLPHTDAWEMACDSTVDKRPPHRAFSLPFGFVQSPIVASVVLAQSALGGAIRRLSRDGMTITVYVDDITLSGPNEHRVGEAIAALETAAALSGFTFNADKTQPPGNRVRSFNITFGSGTMEVVEDRIAEFEIAIRSGSDQMIASIVGYVDGINADQGNRLMEACENAPAGE